MRKFLKCIALLAFLAALLPLASASGLGISDLPEYLVFKEVSIPVSFSVANDSGNGNSFSMEVLSPAKYEIVGVLPKFLKAGEKARIELRLIPPSGVQKQYYKAKVIFTLGTEKTEKSIQMNFLPAENCTIDFSVAQQKSGKAIALSVVAKNNSVEPKSFMLKRLEKVPSDWTLENATQARLEGLETKTINFALDAQSAYKGKANAVFVCAGKEVKAEFNADYNGSGSPITGIVSGIGSAVTGTLALNIALFVIAAILVLAFASRFLKRVGRK